MNTDSDGNFKEAEILALKAVHFILADAQLQQGFQMTSGIASNDFKEMIENPEFLGGVLDFLLDNEKQLLIFCEKNEIDPTEPARARQSFPGAVNSN